MLGKTRRIGSAAAARPFDGRTRLRWANPVSLNCNRLALGDDQAGEPLFALAARKTDEMPLPVMRGVDSRSTTSRHPSDRVGLLSTGARSAWTRSPSS